MRRVDLPGIVPPAPLVGYTSVLLQSVRTLKQRTVDYAQDFPAASWSESRQAGHSNASSDLHSTRGMAIKRRPSDLQQMMHSQATRVPQGRGGMTANHAAAVQSANRRRQHAGSFFHRRSYSCFVSPSAWSRFCNWGRSPASSAGSQSRRFKSDSAATASASNWRRSCRTEQATGCAVGTRLASGRWRADHMLVVIDNGSRHQPGTL